MDRKINRDAMVAIAEALPDLSWGKIVSNACYEAQKKAWERKPTELAKSEWEYKYSVDDSADDIVYYIRTMLNDSRAAVARICKESGMGYQCLSVGKIAIDHSTYRISMSIPLPLIGSRGDWLTFDMYHKVKIAKSRHPVPHYTSKYRMLVDNISVLDWNESGGVPIGTVALIHFDKMVLLEPTLEDIVERERLALRLKIDVALERLDSGVRVDSLGDVADNYNRAVRRLSEHMESISANNEEASE